MFEPQFLGQVRLAGQARRLAQVTWPSDYVDQLADYKARAAKIPGGPPKPLQDALTSCDYFMTTPGAFSPLRMQGCMNSAMFQLQALGV
jgi:hypothetical protein